MLKYFIGLLFFLLFIAKSHIFYLNKAKRELQMEWKKVRNDLDLLNIEWRYLNQPSRLQSLVKKIVNEVQSEPK